MACQVVFPAAKKRIIPPIKGVEWWETQRECEDAKGFVNYIPRTTALFPSPLGFISAGLPHRACVAMNLPEISVTVGWVRQPEGAAYLFKKENDGSLTPVYVLKCMNKVSNFVYLPDLVEVGIVGPKGDKGDRGETVIGQQGPKGDSGIQGDRGAQGPPGEKAEVTPRKSHKKLLVAVLIIGGAGAIAGILLGGGGNSPSKNPALAAGNGINP